MKYLELSVDLPPELRHPMEEQVRGAAPIERGELLAWNVSPEGVEYALFFFEGDVDAYRAAIEGVESVREYNLTSIDDGSFHSYVVQETREAERRWREAFRRRNLVVIPPLAYDSSGWHLTVVGASEDLHAMLSSFPEDVEVVVGEVGDYDRRHGTVAGSLTDRQFEAVEAAVDVGYYAVPREAGVEAVAEALGCAPSTASTHVRKAESRVMSRLVE